MPLKELEFLVRQHHPEAEILHEISRRQLAEKPSAQTLDRLVATGASESFIARVQAPELVAPQRRQPGALTQSPAAPAAHPAESTVRPPAAPRRGTVAAALVDKIFLDQENQLTEASPSPDGEPQTYLLFFTRAEDKPSRRFMAVMHDRLNQWMTTPGARPLEICRAVNRTVLARHAIGRKAFWPIARYEELDPRLQALSAKPETRIALITQD